MVLETAQIKCDLCMCPSITYLLTVRRGRRNYSISISFCCAGMTYGFRAWETNDMSFAIGDPSPNIPIPPPAYPVDLNLLVCGACIKCARRPFCPYDAFAARIGAFFAFHYYSLWTCGNLAIFFSSRLHQKANNIESAYISERAPSTTSLTNLYQRPKSRDPSVKLWHRDFSSLRLDCGPLKNS